MKTRVLSCLFIIFLFTACLPSQSESIETIDTKVFAEKLKNTKTPQLIDVRTPEEFNQEHIDNAANINWKSDDFVSQAEKLDKSKPVFVYCRKGRRSHEAATKLAELGFTKIYDLEGGYLQWCTEGYASPSAPPTK